MKTLIAGNWKMNKTVGEAIDFIRAFLALEPDLDTTDVVIVPPFTALAATHLALGDAPVGLGAQTMWYSDAGAFTGEIAPPMLLDCGASWVILGHSERRAYAGESDEAINKKVILALAHKMTPIVAVGETKMEHAAGLARTRVCAQTQAAFASLEADQVARCVVAYEPIWAIGTGESDSPSSANATMGQIRASVAGLEHSRLLYGGSVKPENIGGFIAQPHIDGALVGGASLDPVAFAALVRNAQKEAPTR